MKKNIAIILFFLAFTISLESTEKRLIKQKNNNFFVYSPPKCGTFLIGKTLELITKKKGYYSLCDITINSNFFNLLSQLSTNNQFLVAHNFSPQILSLLTQSGYRFIFIIRDPRDHILSTSDWMGEGEWSWIPVSGITNTEERITELITGSKYGWKCYEECIGNRLDSLKSIEGSRYAIIRFEDLVGRNGGGSLDQQIQAINLIAQVLDIQLSYEKIIQIADQVYGGTTTFRSGQIGRWRTRFSPEQKKLFNSLYGNVLLELNYPLD